MIDWRIALGPLCAAALAAAFVSVSFWDGTKQALLVALSVIAAGVLVRLARGLPFNSPDHYEVEEIRSLTGAVEQIMRSLRVLMIVILAGMIGLISANSVRDVLSGYYPEIAVIIERSISGIIGLIIGYVFFRMLQVVKGDQDLTRLQSRFIVRAVERRQAKQFEASQNRDVPRPFKSPEGYGRLIQ